jgi:ATP-dependent exoDNAse (exonuclease V) beta subunit
MTVHTAKRLEFPVVILGDMTANLQSAEPDRYVDAERGVCATRLLRHCSPRELLEHAAHEAARERAEGVRVCYVAASRARDILVVPALGDGPHEGWLAPLNKAIYPERKSERRPEPSDLADFRGDRTVLRRPFPPSGVEDESIRPGVHKPEGGDHRVIWWDPSMLHLEVEQNHGLRDIDVLKAGGKAEQNLAAYRQWRDLRARRVEVSRAPEFIVTRVTDIEHAPPEYPVVFLQAAETARCAGGRTFGSLVHSVLRDVPAQASPEQIKALASMHARIVSAADPDVEAVAGAVAAVLSHPVWREALSSGAMHREWPVTLRLDDTRVLEGVLDLAYRDKNGWVVVDYKTDADLDINRDAYVRQLRWYVHALATATGEDARGVLLQV